jgi:uncharacterized repeat protein (TIGR01451 family)
MSVPNDRVTVDPRHTSRSEGRAPRLAMRSLALLAAAALTASSGHARADSFPAGSLIVPMDTDYQDDGIFKAYGLVYELLRNGVPVRWVIRSGKAFGDLDFTASAIDHATSVAITSHGYRGGPWVIDAADAAAALPIVDAWQSANPETTVHEATAAFSGDVAKLLVVAPKIAMFADGSQNIARGYLHAAGIPDSTLDPTWPDASPDMLSVAAVEGPSLADHGDGALFDQDGDPAYCQFMSMHWGVNQAVAHPEVVAEVREFLNHPTHFFAECQAVNAFENLDPYGFFLTPHGFLIMGDPNGVDHYHDDQTFAQMDGTFQPVGGSERAYSLPPGDTYKAGGVTMITAHGYAEGEWDVWMTGYLDGVCSPGTQQCGNLGKVSYLGGHQYTTTTPLSTHPTSQGTRLFLNSLFDSYCATADGQPVVSLAKSAPANTADATVTFTLTYGNVGPSVVLDAMLTDTVPAGAQFVSATGNGQFSAGVVSWSLGNLGVGESGSESFTVTLGDYGTYDDVARLDYYVGLTPLALDSNTTHTTYGNGTGGAGGVGGTGAGGGTGGVAAGGAGGAGAAGGGAGAAGGAGGTGTGASGPNGGTTPAGDANAEEDSNCGCRLPGRSEPSGRNVAWLLMIAATLGAARRRARRSPPGPPSAQTR